MNQADQPLSRGQRRVCAGLGLVLLGLGVTYVVAPELIEYLYGVDIPERGKYGMHYAVGVRDLFYGLLLLTLTNSGQRRVLAIAIGLGVILPLGDAAIVLFHEGAGLVAALPHLVGVVGMIGMWWWVR